MSWIVQIILKTVLPALVDLGIRFGLPKVIEYLIVKLPWLSPEAITQIITAIEKAIKELVEREIHPTSEEGKEVRKAARRECVGIACAADLK